MGVGSATGKDKAEQAAKEAISSPLLETSIKGAKGILMSISVSPDVSLDDVTLASTLISEEANPDANIIWGVAFDPDMEDEMKITIIATGFEKKPEDATRAGVEVPKNPGSPFKKEITKTAATAAAPAQPTAAPAPAVKTAPAGQPTTVKKVIKTVKKPVPKTTVDDDFDDILGMMQNAKKK